MSRFPLGLVSRSEKGLTTIETSGLIPTFGESLRHLVKRGVPKPLLQEVIAMALNLPECPFDLEIPVIEFDFTAPEDETAAVEMASEWARMTGHRVAVTRSGALHAFAEPNARARSGGPS